MRLSTGIRLGPYEIVGALGSGGMGEVYRARDSRLGRDVALKVLPTSVATNSDRLRRFEQEARATAALNHPNILSVFDVGQHEGQPYVVSELLDGRDLRAELMDGAVPMKRAIEWATQVCQGLAAAHDKTARGLWVAQWGGTEDGLGVPSIEKFLPVPGKRLSRPCDVGAAASGAVRLIF